MVSVGRRKVAANQWLKLPDCCVLAAAMQAKQRAEEALKDRGDQIELAEAQVELARAVAQLKAPVISGQVKVPTALS